MQRNLSTLEQLSKLDECFVQMVNEYCNVRFTNFTGALNHFKGLPDTFTSKFNWKRLDQMVGFDNNGKKSKSYISKFVTASVAVNQEVPNKVAVKQETLTHPPVFSVPKINPPVMQLVIPAIAAKTESEERLIFSAYVKELSFCDSPMLCPLQESFQHWSFGENSDKSYVSE
ncbi:Hypothetical_protein [Hexamita inflata]|uniref:Hypothetical_protein n=1 Tax=Hexamita inflata TaxID=28002 RepID=A0AA86QZQ3_9EUKA|nr:Hypothetical protein HINF_LOCUS53995 [Hexamita inflata]CAI9966352.1 Hypothetical protein HINF_LOCUS53997 [Hexamita inflata]